jgi:hypothetical protein
MAPKNGKTKKTTPEEREKNGTARMAAWQIEQNRKIVRDEHERLWRLLWCKAIADATPELRHAFCDETTGGPVRARLVREAVRDLRAMRTWLRTNRSWRRHEAEHLLTGIEPEMWKTQDK